MTQRKRRRFSPEEKFNIVKQVLSKARAVSEIAEEYGIGSINRHSRKLSRTLFTQSIRHFANASPELFELYSSLKIRRGAGRARIALLRRLFIIMRSMLLTGEEFKYKDEIAHKNKVIDFQSELIKLKNIYEQANAT